MLNTLSLCSCNKCPFPGIPLVNILDCLEVSRVTFDAFLEFHQWIMSWYSGCWQYRLKHQVDRLLSLLSLVLRAHNLKCHINKLLNKFFLDIFCHFSGPFYISFFQLLNINWTLLPTSGGSIINFSNPRPQNCHTLRKLLLFSGTVITNFSLDFPFSFKH